ncbi:MAG: RtcB family protein [Caldilineaceae bacterium]
MTQGAGWCQQQGLATEHDLLHSEASVIIVSADAAGSSHAYERGADQLGTLGAGNHFEIDQVVATYDETAADAVPGLASGTVVVQIHCGSRAGPPSLHRLRARVPGRDPSVQDRAPRPELVCAPLDSPEGEAYCAMRRCANFAFANRQTLAALAREAFEMVSLPRLDPTLRQVYDVAHNIGKVETHTVNGRTMQVYGHRKGATRASVPAIPTCRPIIARPAGARARLHGNGQLFWPAPGGRHGDDLGSTCHGAGREMSRTAAQAGAGRSAQTAAQPPGYPRARRQHARSRRGGAPGLQSRGRRHRGGGGGGHCPRRRPAGAAGRHQGVNSRIED